MEKYYENDKMTQKTAVNSSMNHMKYLVVTAVAIALTYVFTAFINIRLPFAPNGGLIHLGNVPLFVFAIIFGKKTGAVAGGVGMGLFDLLSGWTIVAMLAALAIKIGGYYIAEGIIYGNWLVPLSSIPGNVIQVVTAMVIVMIIIEPLRRAANKILF